MKAYSMLGLFMAVFSFNSIADDVAFTNLKLVKALNDNATEQDFNELPVYMTFPESFVIEKQQIGAMGYLFIRSPSTDAVKVMKEKDLDSLGEGFFSVALSMNVGYDPGTNKFSGEGDPQEFAKKEKIGMKNIIERRADKNGVPIFETSADLPNGRVAYIAYIALGNSHSAFRVTFWHSKEHNKRDLEIWNTFIGGLGGNSH